MIIDKIENYKLYNKLSQRITVAFDYIIETDFTKMVTGKYPIDNDCIYAIIQNYRTKEKTECKLEGHYQYIDIQYIIDGTELMGVTSLTNQTPTFTNLDRDYSLYDGESSMIRVEKGMFTIFFPDDLHMPCVKSKEKEAVKKVVVKIKI